MLDVALEYVKKPTFTAKWRAAKWLAQHPTLEYSPFPLQAKVEITRRCNLRCEMCIRPYLPSYPDMTEEQFKQVMDKLGDTIVFQPHGYGEPLMHPQFQKFMEFVTEKKMLIHLVTNGNLLYGLWLSEFMSNCHPLKITYSIDAGHAKEYESIRVGGNFPFLMDNLSQAVAFKRKHGLTTHLNWYCTIGDYNVGEAERIVELANQIGLDSVNFTDLTLHGFGLAKNEHALRLKDNVADRLKMFEELKAKSPIPVYYLIEKQASCTLPWSQIVVLANGDVYPCCDILNYKLGNLFEQDLGEVWNGEAMIEFRRTFLDNPHGECLKCVMHNQVA